MGRITLDKVRKSFGDVEVIPPLDLTIEDGEFVRFRWPLGLRQVDPFAPHCRARGCLGRPDSQLMARTRQMCHLPSAGWPWSSSSYALYPHMSVRKNIAFPLRMAGLEKSEQDRRVNDAAKVLNLSDYLDRRPGQLSGGQRQRVWPSDGPSCASRRPSLFDEPLSNLDAAFARRHAAGNFRAAQAPRHHHDLCDSRSGGSHDHG